MSKQELQELLDKLLLAKGDIEKDIQDTWVERAYIINVVEESEMDVELRPNPRRDSGFDNVADSLAEIPRLNQHLYDLNQLFERVNRNIRAVRNKMGLPPLDDEFYWWQRARFMTGGSARTVGTAKKSARKTSKKSARKTSKKSVKKSARKTSKQSDKKQRR